MARIGIFVETPLQLLCAYEIVRSHAGGVHLYLRLSGRGCNDEQLLHTANVLGISYKSITFGVDSTFTQKIALAFSLGRLLLPKYERVYIGSYFSRFLAAVAKIIRYKSLYYLDDGMATLLAQKQMIEKGEVKDLFTFFEIVPAKGQNIEKNDFKFLKKLYVSRNCDLVFFLGQPLVDYGYLDLNDYMACIKHAIAEDFGQRICYIPHRYESYETLSKIKELESLDVLEINEPLELYFLKNGICPKAVFSISSTALITVKFLFPGVLSICYRIEYKNYPSVSHIKEVYDFFDSGGISIIDLR